MADFDDGAVGAATRGIQPPAGVSVAAIPFRHPRDRPSPRTRCLIHASGRLDGAGYRIERVIGTGGMGTIYLAKNPTLPRRDALKVLSAESSPER